MSTIMQGVKQPTLQHLGSQIPLSLKATTCIMSAPSAIHLQTESLWWMKSSICSSSVSGGQSGCRHTSQRHAPCAHSEAEH